MEKYPHGFSNMCGNEYVYFDDVAVNNESFTKVKNCYSEPDKLAQLQFLTDFNAAVTNVAPFPLPLSVSWNWDCCNNGGCGYSYVPRYLNWNGSVKKALEHMVHIADSVDVQVEWNTPSNMIVISTKPHQYWREKGNKSSTSSFYELAYTYPETDRRLFFPPHTKRSLTPKDSCATGD